MISLLNTRPHPQVLTQAIKQAWSSQVRVVEAPLQKLVSRSFNRDTNLPSSCLDADIWVFVSANAVAFFNQALQQYKLPAPPREGVALVAVGKATWQALADLGWAGLQPMPERFDSEGMLALPIFNQVAGKRVVIVRGEVGRDWLAEQLILQGAEVHFCPVYRREALPLNYKSWQNWLSPLGLSTTDSRPISPWALLTSQENAQIWWQHYQAWCMQAQSLPRNMGVIALTPSISDCLQALGFQGQQLICENASQSSILNTLAQLVDARFDQEK
ncbi:uroporphyrinogen-III synthase [Thiomicrospira sp. ALE5]|nr:uroporphyrinogen-III synthase [Thiomicrospira sp. ALE5]